MSQISIVIPHEGRPKQHVFVVPPHISRLSEAIDWLAGELHTDAEEILANHVVIMDNAMIRWTEEDPALREETFIKLAPLMTGG